MALTKYRLTINQIRRSAWREKQPQMSQLESRVSKYKRATSVGWFWMDTGGSCSNLPNYDEVNRYYSCSTENINPVLRAAVTQDLKESSIILGISRHDKRSLRQGVVLLHYGILLNMFFTQDTKATALSVCSLSTMYSACCAQLVGIGYCFSG